MIRRILDSALYSVSGWLRRKLRLKSPSVVLAEEGLEGLIRFEVDLARQGYSQYTRKEMKARRDKVKA